jgi:hypothetical protein
MTKEITADDRKLARIVNRRRSKGIRWHRIGKELGFEDWHKVYDYLYRRFPIKPDGSFDLGEKS